MKKMTVCTLRVRRSFTRSSGLMRSTLAPVVPRTLASDVPTIRNSRLMNGVGRARVWIAMPPDTAKSDASSTMKGMYSSRIACLTAWPAAAAPASMSGADRIR